MMNKTALSGQVSILMTITDECQQSESRFSLCHADHICLNDEHVGVYILLFLLYDGYLTMAGEHLLRQNVALLNEICWELSLQCADFCLTFANKKKKWKNWSEAKKGKWLCVFLLSYWNGSSNKQKETQNKSYFWFFVVCSVFKRISTMSLIYWPHLIIAFKTDGHCLIKRRRCRNMDQARHGHASWGLMMIRMIQYNSFDTIILSHVHWRNMLGSCVRDKPSLNLFSKVKEEFEASVWSHECNCCGQPKSWSGLMSQCVVFANDGHNICSESVLYQRTEMKHFWITVAIEGSESRVQRYVLERAGTVFIPTKCSVHMIPEHTWGLRRQNDLHSRSTD